MRALRPGRRGGGRAVVEDGHRRPLPPGPTQVGAVEGPVDPEGLAQLGRAAAQVAVARGRPGGPRAWRRCPASGAPARNSTAEDDAVGPHTALAHQCMP